MAECNHTNPLECGSLLPVCLQRSLLRAALRRAYRRQQAALAKAAASCRTPKALVLLSAAIALSGCHGAGAPATTGSKPATAEESAVKLVPIAGGSALQMDPAGLRLAGVTTTTVGTQDLSQNIQPAGEIAATDAGTVQVTPRLGGRIVGVFVNVGERVHAGQLLANVDSVDLAAAEAAYETAQAHERLTYNQLVQQRALAKYGTLDQPAIEDAQRTFAAAQAAVNSDQAQIKLDRLTLANTQQLVALGEVTRKPVEDAQNAYAQAQAASVQAKVNLHSTKANLDRAKLLFNSGVFSKQQLEDAQTAYDNAAAAAEQTGAQETLAKTELDRQQSIYKQNLNGASSLQAAQSSLQKDEHTLQNDLTSLALARTALNRARAVRKSGIPVSAALQQAQDAYDEAQVALKGAANTLRLYGVAPGAGVQQLSNGHAVIPVTAPLDGIVSQRSMVVGQMADTSTPIAKIVNLGQVYVNAQVFEEDLRDVSIGSPAQVRVAAFPGRVFRGTVSFIGHDVNPDTRTITVRTIVQNPGWELRPGMFATVDIGSRNGERRMAVPEAALIQESGGPVVYVEVADRTFAKRPVKVGTAEGGRVPVLSGLQPGDRVVVSGNLFLQAEQEKLQSEKRGAA